ncbi:MAG TPA: AgmX/PglI C-terminal domain-containing protein [Kofleriaceae bacterium]|nr:AgmX/PglI C-terminal domain-containing protein [Kofleriaceae bacterium]
MQKNDSDTLDHHHRRRGVEVACTLGDSVVAVQHLTPERRPSRAPMMLYLAGAVFLLLSALAFAKGVKLAVANERALHHWTEVYDLPDSEFRPARLHLGYDYMAFGGLIAGLGALGFGLWRRRSNSARSEFTVGRDDTADFTSELAPAGAFPLARLGSHGAVVGVAPGMSAELISSSGWRSLDELKATGDARPMHAVPGAYELELPSDGALRVRAGTTSFMVRYAAPATGAIAGAPELDRRLTAFLAGSAVVHAAIVLLLETIPPTSRSLALDLGGNDATQAYVSSRASEEPEPEEGDGVTGEGDGAEAAPDEMGAAGTDRGRDRGAANAIAQRSETPKLSRAQAMNLARTQGIAGALASSQMFRGFAGADDYSSDYASADEWGMGGGEGEGAGQFGWGPMGFDPGGGNPHGGTLKVGDDPRYRGPGGSDGGDLPLKKHTSKGPVADVGTPTVLAGGLDKATIRRYIKRKLPQIQYAYEKSLQFERDLSGTVTVTFVIGSNGAVLQASAEGVDNAGLLGMIETIFGDIAFPRPARGGIVRVVYPLHFHVAGA